MNMKQMLSRKVFRGFLSSFLLAFVLPLSLLVFAMFNIFSSMKQDLDTNSRLALEQYRAGTDGQLYALMRSGDNLMASEKVFYFSTIGDPLEYTVSSACFTMLRSLMQDVSTLAMSNADIESAYLYFPNSDSVVGSSFMSAQVYYKRMIQGKFETYEQWRQFISGKANGFLLRPSASGKGSISYMRTSRRGDVTLVLDLRSSALRAPDSETIPTGAWVAIYDKNHQLLYQNEQRFPQQAPNALLSAQNGEGTINLDRERSYIVWRTSDSTQCQYAYAMPEKQHYASLNQRRVLILILLFALLLGGGYLSYIMAKRKYKPIDDLRSQLASGGEEAPQRDDFAYLRDMLMGMQDEKASIRQRLKASNQSMEHYVLEQLMRGTYTSVKSIEEQLLSLEIVFESNVFTVMGIRLDSLSAPDTPTDDPVGLEESRQLMRFVVHNIFEELFAAYSPQVLEMSNRIYLLITPDQGDDWFSQAISLIEQGRAVLLKHYDMQLSIAVSERSEGMHTIPTLYAWCREALNRAQAGSDSLAWLSTAEATQYDQLSQAADTSAHKLGQLITAGDETAVLRELQALDTLCQGNSSWSVRMTMTKLLSDVIKPFTKRIPQSSNHEIDGMLRALLESAPSPEDLPKTKAILKTLYHAVAMTSDHERTSDLADRAMRYIERHHTENNLNVSMVADQLGLTPSYASALFKKQTGQSMLDVINQSRIRHAKTLLSQGRLSLDEIAEQAGYYNASTFIRVFKKYEGLTPGQYRATQEGNENEG